MRQWGWCPQKPWHWWHAEPELGTLQLLPCHVPHSSRPAGIILLALGTLFHPAPHLQPGCPGFHRYFARGEVRAAADGTAQSSARHQPRPPSLSSSCFSAGVSPNQRTPYASDAQSYSLYNKDGQRGHTSQSSPTWWPRLDHRGSVCRAALSPRGARGRSSFPHSSEHTASTKQRIPI